jgi:hypothetical protein
MFGHSTAGATDWFINDGGMVCMLEHAYHRRVAGWFIKNGRWDAYLRVHAKVMITREDRTGAMGIRDACLRAHAKVTGGSIAGETGATGCMLEGACKSSQERIGREQREECLRTHANHCRRE